MIGQVRTVSHTTYFLPRKTSMTLKKAAAFKVQK
jgi:hypothetical protein